MKLDGHEQALVDVAKEISYYLQKSGAKAEDSADIAQDVLIKLLESELILPFTKVRAWMYRVAVRLYIDRYRREKSYFDLLQREFFYADQIVKFDDVSYQPLHEQVARLPDRYRLVIDSYYFQDFSVKEIAQLFGWSQSKVKINLMRGRQELHKQMQKAGYNYEDFL